MNEPLHIVCPSCDAINRIPAVRLNDNPKCGKCSRHLFDANPMELTSRNFNKHITRNDIPVLVDFWAPWCGPCKVMAPAFQQASRQLEPRVRLAKVNTESEQSIGRQFDIRSIPTMVIFQNGREKHRQAGALGTSDIVRWTSAHL